MTEQKLAGRHSVKVSTDSRTQGRRSGRREAMMAAAESLFLERGYEHTTLAAIVQHSGGSLATLYELFGNKQGLLREMIGRIAMEDQLPVPSEPTPQRSCADQLRSYAHALYAHFTRPRAIALKRIVMTEALRDARFAGTLYQDFHISAVEELSQTFSDWAKNGYAQIDNTRAAADLFFATIMGDAQIRFMCMNDEAILSEKDIDWRLEPFIAYFKVSNGHEHDEQGVPLLRSA